MIVILGGGLAGLATAWHLARRLPEVPRVVLEKEPEAGGLCRSRRRAGFTFDFTGHYLHLRDPETIAFVEELLGDELVEIERVARIHSHGAMLPFPFQANLHGLPADVVARCVLDFVEAARGDEPPRDGRMPFGAWARAVFGDAIAEAFMLPYNRKLFCREPDEITAEWVAWAVPRPSLEQVVRGALGARNEGMGYNPRFRYPRGGGIGILPQRLAERVAGDLELGAEVVSIDARERRVVLADGRVIDYERLVSTLPLPYLLQRIRGLGGCPARGTSLAEMAGRLRWTRVVELGLGVAREQIADGAHWIYFPEPEYRFYRVGFPSNVCRAMAPDGCSSLSVEFAFGDRDELPADDELLDAAREGLERAGILEPGEEIIHVDRALLDPAYVLFDEARTPVVEAAMARLAEAGIESIGRFGAWTYSYMERALIDGREAADRLAHALAER
ncbi:MAG: FAD-dependent oxidoreductase [Acidobacteriota bacterium]